MELIGKDIPVRIRINVNEIAEIVLFIYTSQFDCSDILVIY